MHRDSTVHYVVYVVMDVKVLIHINYAVNMVIVYRIMVKMPMKYDVLLYNLYISCLSYHTHVYATQDIVHRLIPAIRRVLTLTNVHQVHVFPVQHVLILPVHFDVQRVRAV